MGVTFDKNFDFKNHVNELFKNAGKTLHAFARISDYMDVDKLRIMMNTFIISQFSYYPLICMFHDRSVNKKINEIHERVLRIAFIGGSRISTNSPESSKAACYRNF